MELPVLLVVFIALFLLQNWLAAKKLTELRNLMQAVIDDRTDIDTEAQKVLRRRLRVSRRYQGEAPITPTQHYIENGVDIYLAITNDDSDGQHADRAQFFLTIHGERFIIDEHDLEEVVIGLQATNAELRRMREG